MTHSTPREAGGDVSHCVRNEPQRRWHVPKPTRTSVVDLDPGRPSLPREQRCARRSREHLSSRATSFVVSSRATRFQIVRPPGGPIHDRFAQPLRDGRRVNPWRPSPTRRRSGRQLPLDFPTRSGHSSSFPVTVASSARRDRLGLFARARRCFGRRACATGPPGRANTGDDCLAMRFRPTWSDTVRAFARRHRSDFRPTPTRSTLPVSGSLRAGRPGAARDQPRGPRDLPRLVNIVES